MKFLPLYMQTARNGTDFRGDSDAREGGGGVEAVDRTLGEVHVL